MFFNDITITNCTLKHMSTVIFIGSTSVIHADGKILMNNNIYSEVTDIIHSETVALPKISFSMLGQQLTGKIMSGYITESVVSVTDCSLGGILPSENSENINVLATASTLDGLRGNNTTATIIGSLIQPSNSHAVSSGVSATIMDCQVTVDTGKIVESGGVATIASSNVSESEVSDGVIYMLNSKYNSEIYELRESNKNYTLISTNEARNGATKAFKLMENSINTTSSVNSVISNAALIYNGTDTTATAYMMFDTVECANLAHVFFQVIDDGILKTISATLEDDDGVWGGYDASTIKKKATIDLTGLNIPTNSRVRFFCLITSAGDGTRYVVVDEAIIGA